LASLAQGPALAGRDLMSLFNLKAAPGYYNEQRNAALLRRSRQQPYDQ
jgi:hypothetical protein